jgi:hypothetical protein
MLPSSNLQHSHVRKVAFSSATKIRDRTILKTVRNRTFRGPIGLNQYIINSIEEAQHFATSWLWVCKTARPHMGIGGITPAIKPKMTA